MIWLIGLGGSLGAALRFLFGSFISNRTKRMYPFPMGTWLINISGSFLLGIIANLHQSNQLSDWAWYFIGVGFCGAYTTFSTFGYETITLIHSNKIKIAILYVVSSFGLGVISAVIGFFFIPS